MRKRIEKTKGIILPENDVLGADSDHSEQPANIFTNLNNDDGEAYSTEEDSTSELDKKRIHDK